MGRAKKRDEGKKVKSVELLEKEIKRQERNEHSGGGEGRSCEGRERKKIGA